MAFSFRAGTNWCHDFPKLARESGFCFNLHRSRVRVDWNRIGSIDIERVVRERDFQVVDENVNNVIDYCLESEYDVKILDPNFVKLFRLAQLAVEYLLYCKQYLDQSVAILRGELKTKIGENMKLKKEAATSEEIVRNYKEKSRDKGRACEKKIGDSHGEVYKCPHCPKTFISATFVNAHIARRHLVTSEVHLSAVQELGKGEAEKLDTLLSLHNEIKNLKERVNQNERIIRNESDRNQSNNSNWEEKELHKNAVEANSLQEQHKKYQEEISSLKAMFFNEIKQLKQSEQSPSKYIDNEVLDGSIKTLVDQQEKEIERLKNQLQEKLSSDLESMLSKFQSQEDYWRTKLENLEKQHQSDIENLSDQLKLTQETSTRIKAEYETKISELKTQTLNQSKILNSQSEKLSDLTREMYTKREEVNGYNDTFTKKETFLKENNAILLEDVDDLSSQESTAKFILGDQRRNSQLKENSVQIRRVVKVKSNSENKDEGDGNLCIELNSSLSDEPISPRKSESLNFHTENLQRNENRERKFEPKLSNSKSTRLSLTETSEESDSSSEEESSFESESESAYQTDNTVESVPEKQESREKIGDTLILTPEESEEIQNRLRENLFESFHAKLKDLGIDPDWEGIPKATFKQKMEILQHHEKLNCRKFPRYEKLKRKLLEEVKERLSTKQKESRTIETRKSTLDKLMTNMKTKALKALNIQKNIANATPIIKSRDSTPRQIRSTPRGSKKFSLDILPKKLNHNEMTKQIPSQKHESNRGQSYSENSSEDEEQLDDPVRANLKDKVGSMELEAKALSHSYESIKDFIKDVQSEKKLHRMSLDTPIGVTRVTSTPRTGVVEDNLKSKGDNRVQKEESSNLVAVTSPKNNKSMLKTTTGSVGSLVKKKVLFDLEQRNSPEKMSTSLEELVQTKDLEVRELNDSDWNVSSISEERKQILQKEKFTNADNIVLKTSQSDKIAEISRKIEEQLSISRRKPVGAIEAMFLAKSSKEEQPIQGMSQQSSTSATSSVLQSPQREVNRKVEEIPRPAPRNSRINILSAFDLRETDIASKDSDLESDIDELLQIQ